MTEVFICDYIRTPIGRFGGALAPVRADDLGAGGFGLASARWDHAVTYQLDGNLQRASPRSSGRAVKSRRFRRSGLARGARSSASVTGASGGHAAAGGGLTSNGAQQAGLYRRLLAP